ncbi:hypothetical protein [Rhodospirillum rubrum]|uniref:hypothetical protein n=1 Tax=Rhodospirillum rubrum TaxID=1085 RepID=UPI0011D19DA9|nr:hypothetical protein [Rhodospirillum rubrum]QXG80656.1 hypothetical protein KUL73_00790 [Rhodospirillum rubrum]
MKNKKLIIDTNILLLLVIGSIESGRHIRNSKRLSGFDIKDYRAVVEFIGSFEKIYITPYIATEVSNLIDLNGYAAKLAFGIARSFFLIFEQIESTIVSDSEPEEFLSYGITDSSLVRLSSNYTILTNDKRLLGPLFSAGGENIIPFEMVRSLVRGSNL